MRTHDSVMRVACALAPRERDPATARSLVCDGLLPEVQVLPLRPCRGYTKNRGHLGLCGSVLRRIAPFNERRGARALALLGGNPANCASAASLAAGSHLLHHLPP